MGQNDVIFTLVLRLLIETNISFKKGDNLSYKSQLTGHKKAGQTLNRNKCLNNRKIHLCNEIPAEFPVGKVAGKRAAEQDTTTQGRNEMRSPIQVISSK